MNIIALIQKVARLSVCTAAFSILFVPVQAAENVPVPELKPVLLQGSLVPTPQGKPDLSGFKSIEIVELKEGDSEYQPMSLNLASLFSTSRKKPNAKVYPHGYTPLSSEQSKLYARIFEMQALGQMDDADLLFQDIKDDRLMGHVLSQRYLHKTYRSQYSELSAWMDNYADHPTAHKIHKLAQFKGGNAHTGLKASEAGRMISRVKEPTLYYAKIYRSKMARSSADAATVRSFEKTVKKFIRSGDTLDALKYFKDAPEKQLMDSVERDALQADIAASLLYRKRFSSAYKLAQQSAMRSGRYVPSANWVAGLASWQTGQYAQAALHFDKVSQTPYASGWLASAGAFWAARSHEKTNNTTAYKASLKVAAKHSRTFYGLMATHLLGTGFDFKWDVPEYTLDHEEIILSHAAGQRAMSLVAANQHDQAEAELMRLKYKGDTKLRRAVLAYASHVGLPGVALRLGNLVKREGGSGYYDSALYPVSPWDPEDGYRLDPALVHAVIRQESRFNLQARSHSGAIGLMQVMPKTATYVAQKRAYPEGLSMARLNLPEVNMKVGQDYLEYLLNGRYVKGDVISLLVAYNAGPGNLLKWRKRMGSNQDLLLFIEMMPVHETREYVERVLSNYWIYRMRAGLELPSLAAISNGKMPKYAHVMQEEYPYKLAINQ